MSAPITQAHYDLRRQVLFSAPDDGAQLIADSEAAAVAKIRAERDQLLAILVYADRILDDIDTCSDAHKPMYSSYSQNVFKLCIKGRDARRAAIDAAMKEGK